MIRALVLAAGLLAGGAGMAEESFADSLEGSEWVPVEVAGAPVPEESPAMLQFGAEGRVAGNGGCNRFAGTFTVGEGAISFGPMAVTRMMCPPPMMALERAFLDALAASVAYVRDGIALELGDASGTTVMTLRQTDWE